MILQIAQDPKIPAGQGIVGKIPALRCNQIVDAAAKQMEYVPDLTPQSNVFLPQLLSSFRYKVRALTSMLVR